MPHTNIIPDDMIKDSFRILSRKQRPVPRKLEKLKEEKPTEEAADLKSGSQHALPLEGKAGSPDAEEIERDPDLRVQEILASRKSSSHSIISSQPSDSRDNSRNFSKSYGHDDSFSSTGSVSRVKDYAAYLKEKKQNMNNSGEGQAFSEKDLAALQQLERAQRGNDVEKGKRENKDEKKKNPDDERRKNTWIPCTCPQFKVSKDLVTRKDVQAVFFAKVLVIKVVQLMVINLIVFATAFRREQTVRLFKRSHDWVYLAYGLFVALLICIRIGMTYRARWPVAVSFILMFPLTIIIAFISSCVTVVYNSILIPLMTSTLLLTYIMLSFAPYLLRKYVMHRITNGIAGAFTFLSSVVLIFLKEFEGRSITYWEFISTVWLPATLLSAFIIQASIIEIQRLLFGLCFNVSSRRWHIAAMYL